MSEVTGKPFPTIGIMGGGQLGRMMALVAIRMGMAIKFLVPTQSGGTMGLGTTHVGDWTDPTVLREFIDGCDVITVESEWAPIEAVENLGTSIPCYPQSRTLSLIRDKGIQKTTLKEAGLPVPPFACCSSYTEALNYAQESGFPVVVKRYKGSYDGYGNATAHTVEELKSAWTQLADENGVLIEAWVPFTRELSVLVARSPDGDHVTYPVAYTEQRDHRCHAVEVPTVINKATEQKALEIGIGAVEAVDGVGLTAVELFELEDGSILVNELAPRPHNTGHYSIEACFTSQFENHIRGILNWPLGSPQLRVPCAVMVNILGHRSQPVESDSVVEALKTEEVSVHIYGKEETRPKRKMGHVTVTGDTLSEVRQKAELAASTIIL